MAQCSLFATRVVVIAKHEATHMANFKISNADKIYVEFDSPHVILHVITHLPSAHEKPGYCPIAKRALMKEVEAKVIARGLAGYQIHWGDAAQPDNLQPH
jgi:hypothetical protein